MRFFVVGSMSLLALWACDGRPLSAPSEHDDERDAAIVDETPGNPDHSPAGRGSDSEEPDQAGRDAPIDVPSAGCGGTAGVAAEGGSGGGAAGSGGANNAGVGGSADEAGAGGVAEPDAGTGEAGAGGSEAEAGAGGGAPEAGSGGEEGEAGSGGEEAEAGSGGEDGEVGGAGGESGEAGSGGTGGSPEAGSGGAGGAGGAGGEAGSGGAPSPGPACSGPPGLYAGTSCTELAPGVERFVPQFPLFSDDGQGNSATKTRWIYLPPGAVIDTSNADRWTFPVGTILFKQFSDPKSGLRVETRRIEKVLSGSGYASWLVQSYAWSEDQLRVSVAPSIGVSNALGTGFDIPSTNQCRQCHELVGAANVDAPIGFNAVQLNHNLGGLDLASLLLRGQLQNARNPSRPNVTLENSLVPGSAVQRAGIGYLHGNCGHCHGGPSPHGHQLLWTPVGADSMTSLPMFGDGNTGAVCHCLDIWRGRSNGGVTYRYRIEPSVGNASGIIGRMRAAGSSRDAMPPVGRKGADATGIAAVRAYIDSLDGTDCSNNPPSCAQ